MFEQVYLAMEAREAGSDIKGMHLVSEFVKKFRYIGFTLHPSDIINEAPGKSSNIAWAARQAGDRYQASMRGGVIVTVMDGKNFNGFHRIILIIQQPIITCPQTTSADYDHASHIPGNSSYYPLLHTYHL